MSAIWTQCAGDSELRRLRGVMWRAVEAQHRVSTSKLVSDGQDQLLLEQILEQGKPPVHPQTQGRHYLLAAPFRYPPLRHGSRFGRRHQRGIFYACREVATALAETAYYRLVFASGSAADLLPLTSHHSVFKARYASACGVDLTQPPFAAHHGRLASPVQYRDSQALGSAMREAGVELFRYPSARAVGGVNIGLFEPRAIASRQPEAQQSWTLVTRRAWVTAISQSLPQSRSLDFPSAQFEVAGRLPAPAL